MFEAVVTFVGIDFSESNVPFPTTKVYRLDFETEEAFQTWLSTAPNLWAISSEQLGAVEEEEQI